MVKAFWLLIAILLLQSSSVPVQAARCGQEGSSCEFIGGGNKDAALKVTVDPSGCILKAVDGIPFLDPKTEFFQWSVYVKWDYTGFCGPEYPNTPCVENVEVDAVSEYEANFWTYSGIVAEPAIYTTRDGETRVYVVGQFNFGLRSISLTANPKVEVGITNEPRYFVRTLDDDTGDICA